MIITYANNKIKDLCCDPEKYGRKAKLPKNVIGELEIAIAILRHMENCGEFVLKPIYNKYRFEKLKNQNGLMSIRLDRKYRLTFFEGSHQQKEFIEIVSVEIQDVTNHYGD